MVEIRTTRRLRVRMPISPEILKASTKSLGVMAVGAQYEIVSGLSFYLCSESHSSHSPATKCEKISQSLKKNP